MLCVYHLQHTHTCTRTDIEVLIYSTDMCTAGQDKWGKYLAGVILSDLLPHWMCFYVDEVWHTRAHTDVHTYTHMHMRTQTHSHTHILTRTYTHAHAHTHTHGHNVHTHTHT